MRRGGISSLWVIRSFLLGVCSRHVVGYNAVHCIFLYTNRIYYTNTGPKEVWWITFFLFGWARLLACSCSCDVTAQSVIGTLSARDMYRTTAELTDLPSLEELPGESTTGLLTALQYSEPLLSDWVPLLDPWEHRCQNHEFSMYDYTCCMSFPFQSMSVSALLLPAWLIRCVAGADQLGGMISLITPLGRLNYFPSCVQWAGCVFDTLSLQGDDRAKGLV